MSQPYFHYGEVKRAAQGRWVQVLGSLGANVMLLRNMHGPCPACGGRDRFRFDDQDGEGTFICSQGGGGNLSGNGFGLVQHLRGCEWREALALVGEALGMQPRIGTEERARAAAEDAVAPEPVAEATKGAPPLDVEAVKSQVRGMPSIDTEWLRRRSPVDICPEGKPMSSGVFLDHLYERGERVLVFINEHSQGDFLWCSRGRRDVSEGPSPVDGRLLGGWRLSQERGVKARPSALPPSGRGGAWFLTNPVRGDWEIKAGTGDRAPQYTRRSQGNVTDFRHFVLEADHPQDVLPAAQWLQVLASLPLPIVAIYTSAGKSIHALVRVRQPSKAQWDVVRRMFIDGLCPLGADAAALTAVRLSRLPNTLREGKMERYERADGSKAQRYVKFPQPRRQELLWLAPAAKSEPFCRARELRA